MDTVTIMHGWNLPFFPMRPAEGPRLTRRNIPRILREQEEHVYIYQPKLNGDRAILGVVNREVYVANRYGRWYRHPVHNKTTFLKLGDGTLFDGEVYDGQFFPFECLACEGRSFKQSTTEEREILAQQMCKLLGVRWMFSRPTEFWLRTLDRHLPKYEGLVRKRADAPYVILNTATRTSTAWLKRKW